MGNSTDSGNWPASTPSVGEDAIWFRRASSGRCNFITYLLRFQQDDAHLRVYDPYLSARNEGDKPLDDATVLQPYGIQSLDERFEILRLDNKHLSLRSSLLELTFNRY